MDRFFVSLRIGKFNVKYDSDYNPEWSNEETLSHIIELNCSFSSITIIPELPNIQILYCNDNLLIELNRVPNVIELYCHNNQLSELPELPNVKILQCGYNFLTTLPQLFDVHKLCCNDNQLTKLPELLNVQKLWCSNNQLTELPESPNLKSLYCMRNYLFSDNLEDWKIIWKCKKILINTYLVPNLFIRWKLTTIRNRLSVEHKEAIICHPKTYYVRELYNENNL